MEGVKLAAIAGSLFPPNPAKRENIGVRTENNRGKCSGLRGNCKTPEGDVVADGGASPSTKTSPSGVYQLPFPAFCNYLSREVIAK
jgi:hypothetical protein